MKYGVRARWLSRFSAKPSEDECASDMAVCDESGDVESEESLEALTPLGAVAEAEVTEASDKELQTEEESPWEKEAIEVGRLYPRFDWEAEQKDPRFVSMLQAGVPMLDAYRALHMEEVLTECSERIRTEVEKRITHHVQARGSRPSENGTAGTQGVQLWQNVHRLTRQKRAEIASRAHNGERISFR